MEERATLSVGESVASSAVKTAFDIKAKLIVIISDGGKLANYVAKFRPGVSALMLSPNLVTCRQASGLLLGMHTIQVDTLEKSEELIEEVDNECVENGLMNVGDTILIISGRAASMKEKLFVRTLTGGKSHGRFVKGGGLFFNRGLMLSFGTL
jgi:pyruvate kinase